MFGIDHDYFYEARPTTQKQTIPCTKKRNNRKCVFKCKS